MQLGPGYTQGTERYVTTLGERLAAMGHTPIYLAGDPLGQRPRAQPGDFISEYGGGALYSLPTAGWMTLHGAAPLRGPGGLLDAFLRDHRPDIVHIANPAHIGIELLAACRRLNIPYAVTTMDFWWTCPKATLLRGDGSLCDGTPPWSECVGCIAADHVRPAVRMLGSLPRLLSPVTLGLFGAKAVARGASVSDVTDWTHRRVVLAGALHHASAVIFPSRATQEAIEPMLGHARWQRIPYGLDAAWFANPRSRPTGPLDPDHMTIGFAGALAPHKAPHLLLEAIRQLGWSRTRVRLAGPENDAPYARGLRTAARGLNVEFLGALPANAMPEFLRSLDLLAMTSIWPENLPFIVLEAQAAGVPVVGSRLPGIADQIGDEQLLFEPGSATDLARALQAASEQAANLALPPVLTADVMARRTVAAYTQTHSPQ